MKAFLLFAMRAQALSVNYLLLLLRFVLCYSVKVIVIVLSSTGKSPLCYCHVIFNVIH